MRQSWFSWKSWSVGATCGLAIALMMGAEFRNGPPGPYQLHVWSYQGTNGTGGPNSGVDSGRHGAYRFDTQTGEVVSVDENNTVTKIVIPS